MVILPKEEYRKLLAHAVSCLPEEACGLIAGKVTEGKKHIAKVYLLPNADHSPTHFNITPHDQLSAILDMRQNGLQPLGNWHSHPETPSRPSEEDKRLAFDPNASYLILSLAEKEPVLRSFSINRETAEEEKLIIQEDT